MPYRDRWTATEGGPIKQTIWDEPERPVYEPYESNLGVAVEDEEESEPVVRRLTDEEKFPGLSERDIQEIKERGYELRVKLGSGKTRDVYRAERRRGNAVEEVVIKIPKPEINVSSVQTRVAMSKGKDWSILEALVSNKIWHPNIAKTNDSFALADGRTVNFESYLEGSRDLATEIKINGGVKDEAAFKRIMGDVLSGLTYLHGRNIVHRDLKPDNILITKDGRAIITDLQTASDLRSIDDSTMPTRGGSPYTSRGLLNAFVRGGSTHSNIASDRYAIGCIAYEMLTGERAFPYKMRVSENGAEIKLGDETMRVILNDGVEETGEISDEVHEKRLAVMEKTMKDRKIARPYRDFIFRCLAPDFHTDARGRHSYYDTKWAKEEFDGIDTRLNAKLKDIVLEEIPRGIRRCLVAGLFGMGITAAVIFGLRCDDTRMYDNGFPQSSSAGFMQREDHKGFGIADYPAAERIHIFEKLAPYIDDAEKRLPRLEGLKEWTLESSLDYGASIQGLNERFVSAWYRTVMLNQGAIAEYGKDGQKRIPYSLSPRSFNRGWFDSDEEIMAHPWRNRNHGVAYLRDCISHDRDVADVYAAYFSGNQRVRGAIAESGSKRYFPAVDEKGNVTDPGYGGSLPQYQQDMTNTAVGLYHITTDPEGKKVNFERLRGLRDRVARESGKEGK